MQHYIPWLSGSGKSRPKDVDGAKVLHIFGEEIAVKATVYALGGFSAHADQKELLEWLSAYESSPEVFVVHNEEKTSLLFSELIKERYGFVTQRTSKGRDF
ncbi:MAG: MBL fold metallo-hydrolase RNA specificity domain-containing protein [Thermodesulfovibrionales bacterium]|jgi:metallo-beta-lactamase family protein